jgi:hypothetical protein
MTDQELLDLVRDRSGVPLIAPTDETGSLRELNAKEREALQTFADLGHPFPPKAARAALRTILEHFAFAEPLPSDEHVNCPEPPLAAHLRPIEPDPVDAGDEDLDQEGDGELEPDIAAPAISDETEPT